MDGSSLFDAGRDALALSDAELIPRSSGRHDDAVGRVNTPADVARWMVREALGAVRGERAAEPLTILEPAAGSGVFVAALCDALVQRDGRGQRDVARALRQIWAIDNDAGVQDAAVRRLRVLTGRPPPAWFRTHYRIGDTLLDPALLPERPVDLVIGNPPWVGVRHARRLTAFADWRDRFGVTEDLYAYFIRWAIQTVRPGGHVALLVPDSWLSLATYEDLRRKLLQGRLRLIVRLSAGTFDRHVFPCFFVWQKAASGGEMLRFVDARGEKRDRFVLGGRVCPVARGRKNEPVPFFLPEYRVSQQMFSEAPRSAIFVPTPEACGMARLWAAPEKGVRLIFPGAAPLSVKGPRTINQPDPFLLSEVARIVDVGIHSRNCRHRLFHAKRTKPGLQRLLQGRQIERYAVRWDSPKARYRWVDVGYVPRPGVRGRRGNGHLSVREEYWDWQGDPAIHRLPERILIRQTSDHIVAARCVQGRTVHYTDNTLFTATLTDAALAAGITHRYLLAYLNSDLVTRLYRFLSGEEGRAQAQIKIGLLRQLPFVWPAPAAVRRIDLLVRRVEDRLQEAPTAIKPTKDNPDLEPSNSTELSEISAHFAELFSRCARAKLPPTGSRGCRE